MKTFIRCRSCFGKQFCEIEGRKSCAERLKGLSDAAISNFHNEYNIKAIDCTLQPYFMTVIILCKSKGCEMCARNRVFDISIKFLPYQVYLLYCNLQLYICRVFLKCFNSGDHGGLPSESFDVVFLCKPPASHHHYSDDRELSGLWFEGVEKKKSRSR